MDGETTQANEELVDNSENEHEADAIKSLNSM